MLKDTVAAYFRAHPDRAAPYQNELRRLAACENDYMAVYPYPFCDNYMNGVSCVKVEQGPNGLPYVMHKGRPLYFPPQWGQLIPYKYRYLCMEQDPESPHRYLTPALEGGTFDVLIDAGCAEGMLALELADRVGRIVLVECDPLWLPCLAATFAPWKDKVILVPKKLSDTDSADSVTLATLARELRITNALLKMDIEGYEAQALRGAGALATYAAAVLCCTYHRAGDAALLPAALEGLGYAAELSRGWMLFASPPEWLPLPEPPYFRKGLVRGVHPLWPAERPRRAP